MNLNSHFCLQTVLLSASQLSAYLQGLQGCPCLMNQLPYRQCSVAMLHSAPDLTGSTGYSPGLSSRSLIAMIGELALAASQTWPEHAAAGWTNMSPWCSSGLW